MVALKPESHEAVNRVGQQQQISVKRHQSETAETIAATMRLLLVEDDVKLVRALARGLGREGYTVDVAGTGEEALSQARVNDYEAIVLDVMLPGIDGFAVCRGLRRSGRRVPVLMLTARIDVSDRIRGLDSGADDYLIKPFDFGELLARLRALIRRGPSDPPPVVDVAGLRLDSAARLVTLDGNEIELTSREFAVLDCLARRAGQVVSRAGLLEHVWGTDYDGSPNIVDVYVGYLRKKLERPAGRRVIRTVRGLGFMVESG
jgi:two-component system OmpR family response regulator